MILKVVDAGCGVGKTTAMINYINQDKENSKFLYITPFLTEVERIKNACKDKNFQEPAELPTKTEDLLRLVEKGYNIVSTHALFKKLTDKVLDLTQFNDYVLIIDEAADVLEEIEITKNDLKTIITEYTTIDENNTVHWNEWNNDYEGRFEDYKNMIQMGGVKAHRSDTGEVVSLVWAFPISIFESFKEVYILTYMFNGQKAYYEYNKVNIIQMYVKDFQLTTEPQIYNYEEQKKLITVIEDEKLNAIGNNRGSLSMSWFSRNAKTALMKQLQNNINNFFKNIVKGTPINQKLWTTFKEYSEVVKGKGYTNAFVPINIRATNDYKESTAVAYIANRYMRNCLSASSLKQHIYTAKDVFNIKCDINKLIPHIEQILKIKYNLKIFNQNPLQIDKI